MLEIKVIRQLAQRRSVDETRENLDYLANLPRGIAFNLHSIMVDEAVEQGLLWNYRGIIRYAPKQNEESERIAKHRTILIGRVRRACQHKRWGRSPWHIEEELPSSGIDKSLDAINQSSADEEQVPGVGLFTQSQSLRLEGPSFSPELPGEAEINALSAKFGMLSDGSRLRIMMILGHSERNVTQLCGDLNSQSQPAVSHHLSLLRHSRLVQPRREGKHNYYELTEEGRELVEVFDQLIH